MQRKKGNKKQLIRSKPQRERDAGAPLDGAAGSGGSGHTNWNKRVDRLA